MDATLETELKLRADEEALHRLAAVPSLGPVQLGPPHAVDELDVYLDTGDHRLAAARWACRLRARDGRRRISLKGPAEHARGEAVHRRPEIEGPAPDDDASRPAEWPPSPARELVLRLAGDELLEELLSLRQRRIERGVSLDGRRVATLSLDRAEVLRGGRSLGTLRVAEVEVVPGQQGDWLDGLADELGRLPGLQPEPSSKLERALDLAEGAAGARQ
jgi:inorganic triphosphatase YgiF